MADEIIGSQRVAQESLRQDGVKLLSAPSSLSLDIDRR
jgi:hypothetical protein